MEKYSKAVSEMYSQFKKKEAHPMEKYIGRLVSCCGWEAEVVGYRTGMGSTPKLIVDASKCGGGGWTYLAPQDVIFKECESYWYASIDDLIE